MPVACSLCLAVSGTATGQNPLCICHKPQGRWLSPAVTPVPTVLQASTQQDLQDAVVDMKKQGLSGVNVLVLGELTEWRS